jgi:hypothetical protein
MGSIVNLGCDIAEIHHQYNAIHSARFGASAYRLVIAAMTGRTARAYQEYLQILDQLQTRLSGLAVEVPTVDAGAAAHQTNQLRAVLSEYATTLNSATLSLRGMCAQLLQDEDSYRNIPIGGQSVFNQDKIRYDRVLLHLEQLGRRLNYLFTRF